MVAATEDLIEDIKDAIPGIDGRSIDLLHRSVLAQI